MRATPDEVKAIIDTDLGADTFDICIQTSNAMVTKHLGSEGLDDALLRLIEMWLAAHFIAIQDPRVTNEKADALSASYEQGKLSAGLGFTRYGQQAMSLDPTGNLAGLGKEERRGFMARVFTEKDLA